MKKCRDCKEIKDLSNFCKDSREKDKLRGICKSCSKIRRKEYYSQHKDLEIKKSIEYNNINRIAVREYNKEYSKNNRDKLNLYEAKKMKEDINFKLAKRIRTRISSIIKGKPGSAVSDLGCSINELKIYLESKFQPGMTWDNWSFEGWHIDHIKPLSSFDLTNKEEFLKACHYTNLQPLWAFDNLSKGAKYGSN